jgi:FtsZ-interacting cell division protein ZipA
MKAIAELSLTAWLAVVAVLVLVAVVLHGRWVARRLSPRAPPTANRVLQGERREPSLAQPAGGSAVVAATAESSAPEADTEGGQGAQVAQVAQVAAQVAQVDQGAERADRTDPADLADFAEGTDLASHAARTSPAKGSDAAEAATTHQAPSAPKAGDPAGVADAGAVAPPPQAAAAPNTAWRLPTLPGGGAHDGPLRASRLRRPPQRIDALIDGIVTLTLEAPIRAELALTHQPPSRRAGSKPFLLEGLDSETGTWEPLTPGHQYGELQAGVLLANRHGPINEIEYSEFVQKIEAFAEAVGATPEVPDMLDVVARARELDQFAASHDAQLVVRLMPSGTAWAVGFVLHNAHRHGFIAGGLPGRLVMPADTEGAPPVLTLAFDPQAALADTPSQAIVREVTLSLDVPQTASSAEPFAAWQQAARELAQDMNAQMLDDAGQALSLQGFAAIGTELGQLYARLELRDMPAGSAQARRLFS